MPSRGLASRLIDNWPAKVLSLVAAVLLFLFYRLNRLEDRYLSVPLAVAMNEDYVPGSDYPRSVRITLRGEANALFKIQEGDVRASLDLTPYRNEGIVRAPVRIEKRGNALGADPLQIQAEPADVPVAMERRISKIVPVTPSFRGFLVPGFELVSFDFDPPEVEVFGPTSAVARVADVPTDFIELSGRASDFAVRTRLVKKESLVSLGGVESVDFRAVVQRSLAVKTFASLEIRVSGLAEGLQLVSVLPRGWIGVRSSSAEMSGFQPPADVLSVDLSALRQPGTYTVPVRAAAPEGYLIERYEPRSVALTVAARKEGRP